MRQRSHRGAGLGWPHLPSWPVLGQRTRPLCSCKHHAGVLPRCPRWLCCFPWCLCIPLTLDRCHTQHELRIQKANKRVVCGHWDLLCALLTGGTSEGRRNGFAKVPQETAAGPPPLPPMPVWVEPWHRCAWCPSLPPPGLSCVVKLQFSQNRTLVPKEIKEGSASIIY